MTRYRAAAFAFLFLFPMTTHATEERPPFVGRYGINCAEQRQCILEIEKAAQRPAQGDLRADVFLAVFTVANRTNFADVKCRIPVHMRNIHDGRLIAGIDGNAVTIERQTESRVFVAGIPAEQCGLDLTGEYLPIGD